MCACTYIHMCISNCLCEHLCVYVKWVYSMCVHACTCTYVYKCMLRVSVCLYVHMSEESLDSPSSHPSLQGGDCNGTDM